jgi:DNA-binding MarR family transcriptional regulator
MEDRRRRVVEGLVEALGSEGRIRTLVTLAEDPDQLFTAYAVAKRTGLRRQDAEKILKKLCEMGWVKQYTYAVKKYQINTEREEVRRLTEFLKAIEAI